MRYRLKRHQYAAFALLVLGAVAYYPIRPAAVDMRVWKPLAVPIRLNIGEIKTPEFKTDLDTEYRLLIGSERRIEFQRHDCMLGMADWQRAKNCAGIPELVDIEWTVLQDGRVWAKGASRDFWGGFYSDTIARQIGEFSAQKGQHYSIVLDVRRDGSELNKTNPRLLVQTQPWEWENAVVGFAVVSSLRILAAVVLAASGLLTLILTPLFGFVYRLYRARNGRPATD